MVPHPFTIRHPPSRIFPGKVQAGLVLLLTPPFWYSFLSPVLFQFLVCLQLLFFINSPRLLWPSDSCPDIHIHTNIDFWKSNYALMFTICTYFFCIDQKPSSAVFILLSKGDLNHFRTNLRAQSFRFLSFFSCFYYCFGHILFASILLSNSSLNLSKEFNLI